MNYDVCVRARELFGDFGCLVKRQAGADYLKKLESIVRTMGFF
jgi:hypothetical protein